jgi:lysyl-tRNA synthetase class 2
MPKHQIHQQDWQKLWMRERVIDTIRAFFKSNGYHEVETPQLVPVPSCEPFLEVFETQLLSADAAHSPQRAFLTSSPEFSMKKMLAAGSGPIFQICKSFRNGEGDSPRHNPEFSILEWYRPNGTYWDILADFEGMIEAIWTACCHPDGAHSRTRSKLSEKPLTYQGKRFNVAAPWKRISVAEAFVKYVGVPVDVMLSEALLDVARKRGWHVTAETTWEAIFHQFLLNDIEPQLGKTGPTVLYDYPAVLCSLCRPCAQDPRFAERFEVFMGGLELGNAFGELTDAHKQRANMEADLAERRRLNKVPFGLDEPFLSALEAGIPPTGGIAVGVDRIVMLFADAASIEEVLAFPAPVLWGRAGS